jgi:hypothetical protein
VLPPPPPPPLLLLLLLCPPHATGLSAATPKDYNLSGTAHIINISNNINIMNNNNIKTCIFHTNRWL